MNIATTSSVLVLRETKTITFTPEQVRQTVLGTVKRVVDPDGTASFGAEDAVANGDGSITVTVALETVQPGPASVAPADPSLNPGAGGAPTSGSTAPQIPGTPSA